MTERQIETILPYFGGRGSSPRIVGDLAATYEASGVVDRIWVWDQLTSWWPRELWRPEAVALAEVLGDPDSFHDPAVAASMAAAATTHLDIMLGTDSIRRGPAELLQMLLSLSQINGRPVRLTLGAGEIKQIRPFGYRREGIARAEDHLRIYQQLLDCEEPFSYEGNKIKYTNAYIGTARPVRPEFFIMGGGPKLVEVGARYADGWVTMAPNIWRSPEEFAAKVASVKEQVEAAGRDPEKFTFSLIIGCVVHEDPEMLEYILEHPTYRFISSIAGRANMIDWRKEGLEPTFPIGWNYAVDGLFNEWKWEDIQEVIARPTRAHLEKSFYMGSPADIAKVCEEYIEAGATSLAFFDPSPPAFPPPVERALEESVKGIGRLMEVCALIKGASANTGLNANAPAVSAF